MKLSRIKDSQLHVIIKPELQYWPVIHADTTDHPTKVSPTKATGITDTGASVTCVGPSILNKLGLKVENLCPTKIVIRTANRTPLSVLGMFPASLQIVGYPGEKSRQAIYVAREIKDMFTLRRCLLDLGCLPAT